MGRSLFVWMIVALSIGCGKGGSPTAPSQPATPTRVLVVSGDLAFGDVEIGASAERTMRVANNGNSAMTVTSLSVINGDDLTASWLTGVVPPGGTQDVVVRFTPRSTTSVSGSIRVNADNTAGANQIGFSGRGVRSGPLWDRGGIGNTVFDMPTSISRVRIVGTYRGNSSNFIVRVGGRLVVNELVGRSWGQERYEGIHQVVGGGVEITNSSGVEWSFTEVRE